MDVEDLPVVHGVWINKMVAASFQSLSWYWISSLSSSSSRIFFRRVDEDLNNKNDHPSRKFSCSKILKLLLLQILQKIGEIVLFELLTILKKIEIHRNYVPRAYLFENCI